MIMININQTFLKSIPYFMVQLILNFKPAEGFAKRIPIGTLYDNPKPPQHTNTLSYDLVQDLVTSSRLVVQQAQSALRFEIEKFNNKSDEASSEFFNIDQYEKVVDTSDSFEVTKAICSTMPKGIFLLYGVADPQTLDVTESFGKTFHLPFISHDQPPLSFSPPSNFSIFMTPSQHKALIDVMSYYDWNKAIYIYDSEQGLQRFQQIYSELHQRRKHDYIKIEGIRLKDSCDSYSLLRHIDSNYHDFRKNFILDFSSNAVLTHVLQQIKNVGMHRTGYHYLITGTRISEIDLKEFKYGGVNFTGFRLVNPNDVGTKNFQKNWSKLGHVNWPGSDYPIKLEAWITLDAVSVIISALGRLMKRSPSLFKQTFKKNAALGDAKCRFEQVQPWSLGLEVTKSIKQVQLNGYTGPISFDELGQRSNFRYEVLEMTFNSHVKQIGSWNDSHGLLLNESEIKSTTLITSNHTKVIVSSIISAPYLMIKTQRGDAPPNTGNEIYEGFCKELADKIADIVGFKYILKLVSDNKYGTVTENGSWNGMVGELEREVADLAIAPLTISSIRERAIDFSKPFMTLGISVMIRKPEKQKPGVLSFTDPLHYRIWLCVVLAYLGVSFVLYAVNSFSPRNLHGFNCESEKEESPKEESNDFNLANSLWFSLSAFMQQGCTLSPRSVSGRVAGSSWWFFTLILISTYTANLAAFLTIERMLTPIQSASDLPKQTLISYGTLDGGSTKDFFRMSKVEAFEAMWKFMEANKHVYVKSTEEGVERVRSSKGKYAFLLESTMNEYYNQKKPCDTMKVGPDLDSKGYGVATRVGHYLKEPVGLAVLQLRESGELTKLHKKWWFDKGECSGDGDKASGSAQRALTLSHVAGIFYILVSGLLFSLVVCFFEFVYKQKKKTSKKLGVPISSIFGGEKVQESTLNLYNSPQNRCLQPTFNGSRQPLSPFNEFKRRSFSTFQAHDVSHLAPSLERSLDLKTEHKKNSTSSALAIDSDKQMSLISTR